MWIGEWCHQFREDETKISAQHYPMVVPLVIVQLVRILLVKFLIILLASNRLEKAGTLLFNALYSYITIKYEI